MNPVLKLKSVIKTLEMLPQLEDPTSAEDKAIQDVYDVVEFLKLVEQGRARYCTEHGHWEVK